MKLLTRSLVAALAVAFGFSGAALSSSSSQANAFNGCGCDAAPACGDSCCYDACDTCSDDCCNVCDDCDDCCDPGWGLFGEAELLFFRYHRADGVRVGENADDSSTFNFLPTYRLSLGTIAPNGLGFRTRYFAYDQVETFGGNSLGIDTYTIDGELFEAFALNENWALEMSGGVRYAMFNETMVDSAGAGGLAGFRANQFDGAGLVTGLEARRAVGTIGLLYARTRGAVVMDDKHVFNSTAGVPLSDNVLLDTTGGMVELAVGGEVNYQLSNGSVLFARSGLEWQNWFNMSSAFAANVNPGLLGGAGAGLGELLWGAPSDVGFAGFTFSAGVSY